MVDVLEAFQMLCGVPTDSPCWSVVLADLILLSDPAAIDRHVVFIHGVRFANTTVWLSTGKKPELWPRWLVEELPGLGVSALA